MTILFHVTGDAPLFDPSGNRLYLNALERIRFYEAARTINHPTKRALCLVLFYTGCRISEALNLCPEHIDANDGVIVFRTLKQREKVRFRAVPVPSELVDELQCLGRVVDPGRPLVAYSRSTAWRTVKNQMRRAELDGIKATPKGLRHAFAITCVTKGVPLPTVQKWMGHARLKTTAIYLNFVGEEERGWAKKVWLSKE